MRFLDNHRNLVLLLIAASVVLVLVLYPLLDQPKCALEYQKKYKLLYLGKPISYESDTHRIIWLENGCGYNIEDRYAIEETKEETLNCSVIMVDKNGGPFFELAIPEDSERVCGAKPFDLTLVPK